MLILRLLNFWVVFTCVLSTCCIALADDATQASDVEFQPSRTYMRQRPGGEPVIWELPLEYESLPELESSASEFVPVPDRWRMLYQGKWYDPYNQNILKGDIPVFGHPGHEWFVELGIISDTLTEGRKVPTPVGLSSTNSPQSTDLLGDYEQLFFVQNLILSFALLRSNTSFIPPEFEFRAVPVINYNYANVSEDGAVRADPGLGSSRRDTHIGFQELFLDYHIANVSERYDFISVRAGIQRFLSDFRGFVFAEDAPGVRFFGTFDNNFWQYNLAWFTRLEKDTNSALNTFDSRHEDVFIANLYRQDLLALGHQVQASLIYREDTAGSHGAHYDDNGFLTRPASIGDERFKNIYSTYIGLNSDGHIGRINTTTALYHVFGSESHNPIAGQGTDISAWLAAAELSYDIDWMRVRSSFMWASGDDDPFDSRATGFDAIFDIPNFAGGDISYWQRQGIPLIAGGGVALVNRLSLLPNFRAGKEHGQSNYVNPGLRLYNLGVDFEILPELKLITNYSFLQFDETAPLSTVRQDGSFSRDIGYDLSAGLLYRPWMHNNVQFRLGTAFLLPGDGLENLYGNETLWDVFSNVILVY